MNWKDAVWQIKPQVERIPGAFKVYKWLTSWYGEGKVYEIRQGPLQGMRWRRNNRLPFWYHLGLYEPHLSSYVASSLRPGDTFWDLGAHAGYHSIAAARAVGPGGQVIAVEPDPDTCAIFREQLALNDLKNCQVIQAAVSDCEGAVTLMRKAADSRTSTVSAVEASGDPLEVPSITLDSMAAVYPRPRLIKMDIEGAEVLALPHGEALFAGDRRPPEVIVATHGQKAHEFSRNFLLDHGYRLHTVPGFDDATLVAREASST